MLERRDVVIAGPAAGYDASTNRTITIDAEAATLHAGAATEAERKH